LDFSEGISGKASGQGLERYAEGEVLAQGLAKECLRFLRPLLVDLDEHLDVRLVRTLANSIIALVRHRNRSLALLLSELGAFLAGPQHAPAGTKRLSNLIHSEKWEGEEIDDYLLQQGGQRVEEEAGRVQEGRALCILDGSECEKAESSTLEGLSPVRSSKARRLSRPRSKLGKGYYRGKPGGPVVVPGFHWMGALVTGWEAQAEQRPVTLGAWHWYAKPLPVAEGVEPGGEAIPAGEGPAGVRDAQDEAPEEEAVVRQRQQEAAEAVLERVVAAWGAERLLHVWDRGFSGAPWLGKALEKGWHFVVRWKKGNKLRPVGALSVGDSEATAYRQEQDGVKAWKLTVGLRAWGHRQVANPRNPGQPMTISFAAREVRLLHREEPLWLVVVRLGKTSKRRRGDGEPWRLLTTEPVGTEEQCWRVAEAYIARWQVEQMIRYGKNELGVESVRVREWKPRHRLLGLVALAYAFLIGLLGDGRAVFLPALLRWAHRTGRQANGAWRSLYRLRAALANLWQKHTPTFQGSP
jgi:hypothetical protein